MLSALIKYNWYKTIKPIIIGICGRSCAGKSTLVNELVSQYKDELLHIDQDKFFKVKADNWERPASLRNDSLIDAIRQLREGKHAHIPTHRWTEVFDREVKPHRIIVVEGYLLFVNNTLSELFDRKIFIEVSNVNLLYRRLKKCGDLNQADYIMDVVIPVSKEYETIQRKKADAIIDGNQSREEIVKNIKDHLKQWHIELRGSRSDKK